MASFQKEDSLNIKINPILKLKFHIAVGFQGFSAVLTTFITNYVRDYEKQYGIIPITLTDDIKYDVLTKFFGVQLDRQTYKKLNHEKVLNLINETIGTNMNMDDFESILKKYPKTRKNVNLNGSTLELLDKNNINLGENDTYGL